MYPASRSNRLCRVLCNQEISPSHEMKLTRHIIADLAEILGGIKINRIDDKEAKAVLLKDYLAIRKVARETESDRNEIIRKFQEDWADEIPAVEKFRKEGKPVLGHLDYLDAEKDANKAISSLFSEEVDIDLARVKLDAISAFPDEITLDVVAFLSENGIIGE